MTDDVRAEKQEWMRVQRMEQMRERDRRRLESKEINGPIRREQQLAKRLEKYDIDPETYNRIMASQGYVCGVCRMPMENPNVDHDHTTGFVRGILCHGCNMAIGRLGDTADSVMRAVNYLQKAELKDPGRK